MASNINTTNIDAAYPVAGQDNDSQGFRDNFSTIKSNFVASKTEIEAIQSTTAQGITYDSGNNLNDFNATIIEDASLQSVTQEVNVIAGVNSQTDINFTNGHYQAVTVTADVTLRFALWPATLKYGKIRMALISDGVDSDPSGRAGLGRRVTWTTESGGSIKYGTGYPTNLDIKSTSDPIMVDVFTVDGGTVVYIEYIGQFTP
tara:strand:+ start:1307 stop:1915 length:609 start_codon:yes stop_codon:yes gene_type:complete